MVYFAGRFHSVLLFSSFRLALLLFEDTRVNIQELHALIGTIAGTAKSYQDTYNKFTLLAACTWYGLSSVVPPGQQARLFVVLE